MGWLVFAAAAIIVALLLVPPEQWVRLWPLGVAGTLILYMIDSTLVYLKAFRFIYEGLAISGLPVPYIIAYIPGGILFGCLRPGNYWGKLFHIFIFALLLLVLELIMAGLGYFEYINWSLMRSAALNIGGFMILDRVAELLRIPGRDKNSATR